MRTGYRSWGGYPRTRQDAVTLRWRCDPLPLGAYDGKTVLPFGNGRSYGDSCLNDGGVLLDARGLSRFIAFDPTTGILRCEAGVLLSEILDLTVPRGWFLPVTPGTKFVTVGGAIANDVHGKNHHRAGTFGCHVRCFELLRSDGTRLRCSPTDNAEWFRATIGGLGLTGVVVWAEIALKRIANPYLEAETMRYRDLDEFLRLSAESDREFEYTVAWFDCLARGRSAGRGVFFRGNHAAGPVSRGPVPARRGLAVPVTPPISLVNRFTAKALNAAVYRRRRRRRVVEHYDAFFYPLDGIRHWNRAYGPRGLLQYQCVVPDTDSLEAVREILRRIAVAGQGAVLAVLKMFGDVVSPGLLSFPRPGITVALDFANNGRNTLDLLESLDEVVCAAGGAVYPGKDARMSGRGFRRFFPRWEEFRAYVDPRFSSSFWRRVTAERA